WTPVTARRPSSVPSGWGSSTSTSQPRCVNEPCGLFMTHPLAPIVNHHPGVVPGTPPREQPEMINFDVLATWLRARFGNTERGASLVEYALLLALIAVVCIVAVTALGTKAGNKFSTVGSSL